MTANTFDLMLERIQALAERAWNGKAELWTDPTGNEAEVSDCTLIVESARLLYTWGWEGERQTGQFQQGKRKKKIAVMC